MKTIFKMNLYNLMAEGFDIWIDKDKAFGFNLEIEDEDGNTVIKEDMIPNEAMEGFADFCKRYLHAFEQALKKEAA